MEYRAVFGHVLAFFGAIFSWGTNAALAAALTIGAVIHTYSKDLPNHEQLSKYAPPTISRIYSGQGALMDEFARERRLFAPAEEIPILVKQAFISAEDKNFYLHKGYDLVGMAKAGVDMAMGGPLRGASTITQQVMKNFLLSSDRTAERKVKELILASRLERTLDKEEILELYLNEIFLGQNSYGVASAAQTYFNKPLEELDLSEVAYLAALPKAPSTYHPVRNAERAVSRRDFVLREMRENGFIDSAEYEEARRASLVTVQSGAIDSFRADLPPRNYFTDEIRRQLSGQFGEGEFFSGGLSIRATVDPELQMAATTALREGLVRYDREVGIWHPPVARVNPDLLDEDDVEGWRKALAEVRLPRDIPGWHPAVVLRVGRTSARIGIEGVEEDEDGHYIHAVEVQSTRWRSRGWGPGRSARVARDLLKVGDVVYTRELRDEKDGSFIRWSLLQIPRLQGAFVAMDVETGRVLAMQGGFSYQHSDFNRATQAKRQPGSAFKPFVYAAALDSGYSPATIVVDAPIEFETDEGIWQPRNATEKFYGPSPLRLGVERSRNLMTIRLANEVGIETVAGYAERFGVYDDMEEHLATSLGSQETTLFRLASAYAMFANGGERVEPTLVDRVQDRWGRTIYRHDRRLCEDCGSPSLPEGRGPNIRSDRTRVMDPITAYQLTSMLEGVVKRGTAAGRVDLDVPAAGKTGTTNEARDVWFVGFSSSIVAGCYMGFDHPETLGEEAAGGRMCAPVFNQFMQTATGKYGGGEFKVPENGVFAKIDRYTGEPLPDDASGSWVVAEFFREGTQPVGVALGALDGGWGMGTNLPMFARGEDTEDTSSIVTTSDGEKVRIGGKASFGSLSSGGLY